MCNASELNAEQIARHILAGFNKHFRLFTEQNRLAANYFNRQQFHAAAKAAQAQVNFYDARVGECLELLHQQFAISELDDKLWCKIKLAYINLLYDHWQPELAESFYNSLFCRLFNRRYYKNNYIFVTSAINTDDIACDQAEYRSYYPLQQGLEQEVRRLLLELPLQLAFEDLERDVGLITAALKSNLETNALKISVSTQINVATPLFYRNKAAYVVGRIVDSYRCLPLVLPILIRDKKAYIDAVVQQADDISSIFSFTRAYLKVDFPVPSAMVRFLRSIVPSKSEAELYTIIGLHKQGKNEFYRDLLHHLRHSTDNFIIANGIEGMVMQVFTLPSFPYVFKLIKDRFHVNKNVDRQTVIQRYRMVKQLDRVGRMADTWEFSHVALPLKRFSEHCLQQLQLHCQQSLTIENERLIIRHLYIERRMIPLNIYLTQADVAEQQRIVIEYGNAITEIARAGIFPGDLLVKNFGVTRHGRVVFYDYDEIIPIEDCNFRDIPPAMTPEQEMAAEPWYSVAENDIFPEEFALYLITDNKLRQFFQQQHPQLMQSSFWRQIRQNRIDGLLPDIYPYKQEIRFCHLAPVESNSA